jgi:hypothetical protein
MSRKRRESGSESNRRNALRFSTLHCSLFYGSINCREEHVPFLPSVYWVSVEILRRIEISK